MSARKSAGTGVGTGVGTGGAAATWHAGPALLAAYAAGRAGEVDAWSLEAHLTACSLCRAELALAVCTSPAAALDRQVLAAGRARLVAGVAARPAGARRNGWAARRRPGQRPARLRSARLHVWWLVRPSALVAVLVALAGAGALDAVARASSGEGAPVAGGGLLWLLTPVIPLAGVALCSVADADPWREAVLSTPSAGLRLVLWRTAAVLALAVPLALGAGLALGAVSSAAPGGSRAGAEPVLWLLPCLALTTTSLALGTAMSLQRAAALVAGLWCLVVAGPALVAGGTDVGAVAARLAPGSATGLDAPVLTGVAAQAVWALLAAGAAGVVVRRRQSYEQLPRAAGRSAA